MRRHVQQAYGPTFLAERQAAEAQRQFVSGLGEGVVDAAAGAWQAARHPVDTAVGAYQQIGAAADYVRQTSTYDLLNDFTVAVHDGVCDLLTPGGLGRPDDSRAGWLIEVQWNGVP